jgi:hypothetical protein
MQAQVERAQGEGRAPLDARGRTFSTSSSASSSSPSGSAAAIASSIISLMMPARCISEAIERLRDDGKAGAGGHEDC